MPARIRGAISDGSFTTTALTLWTRHRRGPTLPIELMVHHITQRTAADVGWFDRGYLLQECSPM